jgi:UDP-glucose 4-epimerase
VTGASGFVGLNVVEHLLSRGSRVVALSHDPLPAATARDFVMLPGRLVTVVADITTPGVLAETMRDYEVRDAIHLAAVTPSATADRRDVARVLDVNAVGTVAMFDAAVERKLHRVVYASSGAVYGDAVFQDPVDGRFEPQPMTLYGITKLMGERLAVHYRAVHGLDVVAARLSAVFGPWERDTGLRATLSVPWQLAGMAVRGETATIDARGTRDWIYARDIARALAILLSAPAHLRDVYDVSLGEVWHAGRIAAALAAEFPAFRYRIVEPGEQANVHFHAPLDRDRRSIGSVDLASEFGFALQFPPDLAAADYARWVRAHRAGFTP